MAAASATLSFRHEDEGGEVKPQVSESEYQAIATQRHLVLLIHGYNNNRAQSTEAYCGFEAMQRELAGLAADVPITSAQLVQVHWPGDADWGIASPLFYPFSIAHAREAAQALAATLERAARENGHKRVDIVAHSMGCRLTLELVKALRGVGDITVGRVVLMAGAVPTFMLAPAPDASLRAAFEAVLADAGLSLYSSADLVLGLAFPLGQTVAPGKEGFFPTALGHGPFADAPGRLLQQEVDGAGHSDYWGHGSEDGSRERARYANRRLREFLCFERVGERRPETRTALERHTAPARPALAERVVTPRTESNDAPP